VEKRPLAGRVVAGDADPVNLRPPANGEEADLFAIHRAVFRPHIERIWGWDEEWQKANFSRELASATTSVIQVDSVTAGYLQSRDEGSRIYVQNIALLPAFQGKGLGTRLMKELQAKAALRGVPLELSVFRGNDPARRFYERLGFRETGESHTHTQMAWRAI
jgi:ribosomal protein S18 acetylase RimI-like enzyme